MKTAEAITEDVVNSRVNRYGQVFAHLYSDRIWIYNASGSGSSRVIPIPKDEVGRVSIHRRAELALNDLGWSLGVDGWRAPLDSSRPMLATAHLFPLGEMGPLWPVR